MQNHYQEKHGNGPNQHHYKERAHNKHAGNQRYLGEKGGQNMKRDHEYHPSQKQDHENYDV